MGKKGLKMVPRPWTTPPLGSRPNDPSQALTAGDLQHWKPDPDKDYPVLESIGFCSLQPCFDRNETKVFGGETGTLDVKTVQADIEALNNLVMDNSPAADNSPAVDDFSDLADAISFLATLKPAHFPSTPNVGSSMFANLWNAPKGDVGGAQIDSDGVYQYDPHGGWDEDPLEVDDD